ncbi:MAG: threonine--tRNA ligase [Solirubrobacteraceae bacterium]
MTRAMHVILPDRSQKELPDGASGADLAAAIGPGLARAALAVKAGGEVRDLARPLADGDEVAIVTSRDDDSLDLIRHDTAHVLAAAVLDLYPGTKISIGPPIQDGFYYDFEFPEGVTVSDADFEALEAKMREHIKAGEEFVREDVTPEAALERFHGEGQDYKVELIEDLVSANDLDTVSLYTNGPFTDLCRGPHAPATDRIKAFKLLSVAGAYWRGDADRQMLTRIYGTAFHSKQDLAEHLERLEQARARDHRKLGRELGLFTFSELSPGSAFWLPRGTAVYNALVARSREMSAARGYQEIKTPLLYDAELWKISGHWDKYREHMFVTQSDDKPMGLKPMNCPGHCAFYAMGKHSYRELPIRYAEPGLLHRNEPSGTLHGLLRVRHFIQDDAHIFCTYDQIEQEVLDCLEFGFAWYDAFGFDMRVELSTRPEQRIGSEENWDRAEAALTQALEKGGYEYDLNEGDGAFYGPKIDLHMRDSLNRSWQLGTVQLDFTFPERFDLTYTGADNAEHQPAMIHRALVGSFERFIGILLEHTGGDLPLWLAPAQAAVLPLADRHNGYANEVAAALRAGGLRADVDERTESVGRKIREAELRKVPYMLVVGDREAEERAVSLRRHGEGDLGTVTLDEAVERLVGETDGRDGD